MNIKTYFSKSNTIIYNSKINTGKNPIAELYYGDGYTRFLFKLDTTKLQSLVDDKTYSDLTKLTHILNMKNCWSLQKVTDSRTLINSGKDTIKERTSSFDLLLVRLPEEWDAGSGYDVSVDGFVTNTNYYISYNGSNWYNSATETPWSLGNGALLDVTGNTITSQHFDIGNEDINIDITTEINNILTDVTDNYGFMLCFPNSLENTSADIAQYVGFFTNNSDTFFKPSLNTYYSGMISDDRNNFYLDKQNKLYFYSLIGNTLTNLDNLPSCFIDNIEYTVFQETKGVYYINLNLSSNDYTNNQMLYDTWTNIIYNGTTFDDVEQEFVVKSNTIYFNFDNSRSGNYGDKIIPTVYGIKYGQKLNSNNVIKVNIEPKIEYTNKVCDDIISIQYKLYVKEINKEITVFDYTDNVNKTPNLYWFLLDTDSLLPNTYYIDFKINYAGETITYKDKLKFEIISEV